MRITSLNIDTSLLWHLTGLFVVLAILYFGFVFFFRNQLSKRFYRKNAKRAKLAPIISHFLFHSPDDPKEEQKQYVNLKIEIREYLSDPAFRKILSDILFDLQRDVAGGTLERLFRLFKELGLHHDCYKKLNSWRWEVVAKGISELSQMKVGESFHLIGKFINDRRPTVRKQAEIAIVSLKPEGINYLLDTTTYSISEWQQLKLIEAMGYLKDYQPPKFKSWLLSHNSDVVLFALRLIKHYNQKEAMLAITELVKHKDSEVKLAAISCIRDFHFVEAVPQVKSVFDFCSPLVKIQLLNVIAEFGAKDDVPFLNGITTTEKNFAVLSKAQAAKDAIIPDSVLPTKDIISCDGNDQKPMDGEATESIVDPQNDTLPTSIEVTEIDIYEVSEDHTIPLPDIGKTKETPDLSRTETNSDDEPAFEFGELDHKMDKSMSHHLGLVQSDQDEIDATPVPRLSELEEKYTELNLKERTKLLDMLASTGDGREIGLLEHIVEHETNAELRYNAFHALKMIRTSDSMKDDPVASASSNQKQPIQPIVEAKKYHYRPEDSVFHQLYEFTTDGNARKILLQQMTDIGDEKEVPFLKHLLTEEDPKMQKLVKTAIETIQLRIDEPMTTEKHVPEGTEQHIPVIDFEVLSQLTELQHEANDNESETDTEDKLPLELIFLYDELGIERREKAFRKPVDFLDFELADEFLNNNESK